MATQAVVVSKALVKTEREARAWARRITGRKPRTMRETSTSRRFRQFSPDLCVRAPRFRRIPAINGIVVCRVAGER